MNGLIDENGVSIWDAECPYDPDEPLESQSMIMTYKGSKQFYWSYVTIVDALSMGVDVFLKKSMPDETVSQEAQLELKTFFEHWVKLVKNEGNIYSLGDEE
jgi:hypothetical protein